MRESSVYSDEYEAYRNLIREYTESELGPPEDPWERKAREGEARRLERPAHVPAAPRRKQATATALERRIRILEQEVSRLRAERAPRDEAPRDEEMAPPNPYFEWIDAHRDELRTRYPNEFVALDPEQGIVFHSADENALAAWIEALPDEERERRMAFHTSMFV